MGIDGGVGVGMEVSGMEGARCGGGVEVSGMGGGVGERNQVNQLRR